MSENPEKKLTLNDPVEPETLQRLADLQGARLDIADKLLSMEQQKVSLLVAARQIDEDHSRVFNKILLDRGLPPGTAVELDASNGHLELLARPKPTQATAPEVDDEPDGE